MQQIDIHKLADTARFNRFHALVLFWCALIIIFDGYDLAVVGIALPSIMKDLGVAPTQAGLMVSSALFGMVFGAIFLGTMADRIGRRWTIAICVALFSVFTAAAGLVKDPLLFSMARFLAGLGIGGVMPNVVAQMTEYAPKKIRATLVTVMFSGYAVGGVLAALLGKSLIEAYGWQSVFLAAGLPVLLIPVILGSLPESMPFLLARGDHEALRRIVSRLAPEQRWSATDRFAVPAQDKAASAPIRHLFHEGRGFSTIMFWIAFFMCLFMVYALSSWLTRLMAGAGYSLGSALTFVLVLNLGAMIGAVGGGWLADRYHIKYVLAAMYALAAVSITLLGFRMPTELLFVVVGLAGASTIGTQIVANAYTGQFYPTAIRSTGLGWALGIGRSGAILAPIVIGVLVAMELPLQQNFIAIAIPAVIGMGAVLLIDHRRSASARYDEMSAGLPASPVGLSIADRN
ncbi:putative arabinose efflux permease AraJ, MFS family [Cupriavidus necator]|uniref:MFS transporter n=1 Tax=Cupriavidus necator (strain ATCC 17699 / DSM 428 / KCTC 22496 / NCIMB 10442 / H16 / Stanier 337) TaxID=381666 RepID=Q0KB60_CUPNH|nr:MULTISPECIES: aromatic acid/H+ symport family MFS transporter [Cupriavidus]EON19189.1 major facilitator superfamily transporter AAHS family protein [Cupriavidus sp. GA3-3]KUE88861.1 MFS transporter [Cupriavidus necator]QCC00630.1 MFS transporter [Cupriavidus necator H16]QQB76546.1 aromatic acid/H+ symport family MFS transporter [Cupriavidus necator]WKA42498.1 aromatic acid/H+ symport family MFS transporter [Cupriavidus necator]